MDQEILELRSQNLKLNQELRKQSSSAHLISEGNWEIMAKSHRWQQKIQERVSAVGTEVLSKVILRSLVTLKLEAVSS